MAMDFDITPGGLPPQLEALLKKLRDTEQMDKSLRQEIETTLVDMAKKLKVDLIEVDLVANTATRAGIVAKLSPHQAALLYRLCEGYPDSVPVLELQKAVYGGAAATTRSINTTRVMVTDLRNRIFPLKANIPNHHGVGYRLELLPVGVEQ